MEEGRYKQHAMFSRRAETSLVTPFHFLIYNALLLHVFNAVVKKRFLMQIRSYETMPETIFSHDESKLNVL